MGRFWLTKHANFLPTFGFEKWVFAHFYLGFEVSISENFRKNRIFAQKKWVFAHFYFKSGQPETVAAQGFEGFLPTFPLFSLIYMKKKIKIYNK